MTPEHRLMKTIGSLKRIHGELLEGSVPADSINTEIARLHSAENMTATERQQLRNALEAMVRGEWWDARARREAG